MPCFNYNGNKLVITMGRYEAFESINKQYRLNTIQIQTYVKTACFLHKKHKNSNI